MRYTSTVAYWAIASAYKPPFSDMMTPLDYKISGLRSEEKIGYSTRIGYRRHVSAIVNQLRADGARIVSHSQRLNSEGWAHVIVYRPTWNTNPHAANQAITVSPCKVVE